MEIESSSASAVVSTRETIFPANFRQELVSGARSSGLNIRHAPADTLNRLLKVLPLPREVSRQDLVERRRRVLPVRRRVVCQLGLKLRFKGYHFHQPESLSVYAKWSSQPQVYGGQETG